MPEEATQTASTVEQLERQLQEVCATLEQARAELMQREQLASVGQIVIGIGHELREPLAIIANLALCLRFIHQRQELEPEAKATAGRYLDCIDEQVAEADRIIRSLIDYARTRHAERRSIDLNSLLEEQARMLHVPENVCLDAQLAPGLPPVLADPLHIERVFRNLVANAVDSMGAAGGELRIATFAAGESIVMEVADTGPGIPEELGDKVFQPMVSTRSAGTGLGLALCRQLVEANQGTISYRSAPGRGAAFQVLLTSATEPRA
jgi:signal transduction histidine kinase